MKIYNILDHNTDILSSKLLEASAGTGKTFTIEHLVTRLLVEKPLRIAQILAVTFTRAAARDLRVRIRASLERAIQQLKQRDEQAPDYLKTILETGEAPIEKALMLLSEALFCFDEAQIFTIHGFCARALKEFSLEGNISIEASGSEDSVDKDVLRFVIKDYFRSGKAEQLLGTENFTALVKEYDSKYTSLEKDLVNVIGRKLDFDENITDLFALAAKHCQDLLRAHLKEKEMLGPDEWLKAMSDASKHKEFRAKLQARYQAVIVDEFQDTDPEQWTIFENLFLDKDCSCPLYLVGDPKQSIYFFRQADIYTYLKAGETLGAEAKASLSTNYRSQPSLVKALNTLFASKNSPGLMPLPRINQELPYTPVQFSAQIKEKDLKDNRGAVHFIFSEDDHDSSVPLLNMMAQEIQRLHKDCGIPYNGIAILVKDKTQANAIYKFMGERKIPIANQRAASISKSRVLDEWRALLQAALTPRNLSKIKAAMGTPIIGWNHIELLTLQERENLIPMLLAWQNLNLKLQEGIGAFLELFCSLKWKKDSLSTLEQLLSSEGGAEHYRDFIHVGELLMEYQASTHAVGESLIEFIDEVEDEGDDNNNEKHRVRHDPSIDAVNLMTTHSSKGLEYEIVFAPGLMEGHGLKDAIIPVFQDSKIVLKANPFEGPDFNQFAQELDAEKMRQLYVAMTRAKYRLYLPACWNASKSKHGAASPMELFLARLGQAPADWSELYSRISGGVRLPVEHFLKEAAKENSITYQILNEDIHFDAQETEKQLPRLSAPEAPVITYAPIFMHSFTSLSKKNHAPLESESEVMLTPPHDFQSLVKSAHTLPSGSDTGNLIHLLIEKIPFQLVQNAKKSEDLIPWVKGRMVGSAYKGWENCLADILYQTFHTPFQTPHGVLTLSQVDPAKTFREIEFLYPSEQGFLKGKIDCILEHGGVHYILDWKSNWLGDSSKYYTEENLRKAILENQYDLQAQIYGRAWELYCKRMQPDNFAAVYGGALYIFVRCPGAILLTSHGAQLCKV